MSLNISSAGLGTTPDYYDTDLPDDIPQGYLDQIINPPHVYQMEGETVGKVDVPINWKKRCSTSTQWCKQFLKNIIKAGQEGELHEIEKFKKLNVSEGIDIYRECRQTHGDHKQALLRCSKEKALNLISDQAVDRLYVATDLSTMDSLWISLASTALLILLVCGLYFIFCYQKEQPPPPHKAIRHRVHAVKSRKSSRNLRHKRTKSREAKSRIKSRVIYKVEKVKEKSPEQKAKNN